MYDLQPGEMVTWPQHTPHRVVNTDGVNVSLSTEHMTSRAARRNNVFLANRHFRQSARRQSFRSTELTGWRPAAERIRAARDAAPAATGTTGAQGLTSIRSRLKSISTHRTVCVSSTKYAKQLARA